MTYCWPNSAFFNFQSLLIKGIADNILAFFFWQIGTNGGTCKKANASIYLYISLYEHLVEHRRMYDQGYISACFIRVMIQPRLYISDMPVKRCKKLLSLQQVSYFPYLLRLSITLKNMNDDIIPLVTIFIMINVKVWNKQSNKQTKQTTATTTILWMCQKMSMLRVQKKKWMMPEKETPITASGLV